MKWLKTVLRGYATVPQIRAILADRTRIDPNNGRIYVFFHPLTGEDIGVGFSKTKLYRKLIAETRAMFGMTRATPKGKAQGVKWQEAHQAAHRERTRNWHSTGESCEFEKWP